MKNTERFDNTAEKKVRRLIVGELCALQTEFLATDYPGPSGRAFIRKLHKSQPQMRITLVNKYNFKKDFPGDSIANAVVKVRKDIFEVIQTHPAKIVDIDLFGGLPLYGMKAVETAPNWKRLLLTFSKIWRHRKLEGAISTGTDPAYFMEIWAKRNGWKAVMPQVPYRRKNKNNGIMGVIDERGPEYYTFLIER